MTLAPSAARIIKDFEARTGLAGIEHEVKERPDSPVLILYVAHPTERLFAAIEAIRNSYGPSDGEAPLVTLKRGSQGSNLLQGAEGRLLLRTLSESLNINRNSFNDNFFARYTKSVFGAEDQITAAANHVVFGRRGAGKSSLLLFALHNRSLSEAPSVWVDMQLYAQRSDTRVICDLLEEVLRQCHDHVSDEASFQRTLAGLQRLHQSGEPSDSDIRPVLPDIRRLLSSFGSRGADLAIFLDDFHVIGQTLQPRLLGILYAIARGNNIFLKLSAIETLTATWDAAAQTGLQIPHDAQGIKLDYNLTIPEKATEHITSILDAHAMYCGLPSIRILCVSSDVLSRLVWVAAGVPRDALNLFAQAMTKATIDGRRHVSVTNVNVAASEGVNTKLRDFETDVSGAASGGLHDLLGRVRTFCITTHQKNSFLVEIRTDHPIYQLILKLVDLRLLHVINEGMSIGTAGRKYLALIWDYGFYVGIRAARSVDLFNRQTRKVAYRDLRKLPVLSLDG